MTKAQSAMYSAYSRATATDLWEVYGRCSSAKRAAMQNCRKLQEELDGWGGRICSASCSIDVSRIAPWGKSCISNSSFHLLFLKRKVLQALAFKTLRPNKSGCP